ncbi:MAG TPA: response regulator [Longimicrobium sp.]|uniref:response regulator n=1 Tax=Longimicrobium sp. TaxID=2029185 RepID=UPI002ED98F3F
MGDERRRLLVVEDSPMMVRMYRMVLGPHYELAFAADGAEGLDAAARDPKVHGMVVDINMPGMDGLEFVRRLRTELGMTDVPVLVCSTEAAEADQAAARQAGANAFLPKPWQPAQLLAAVAERLNGAA